RGGRAAGHAGVRRVRRVRGDRRAGALAGCGGTAGGEAAVGAPAVRGPYDSERVLRIATGRETVSGRELHLREGVVIRPAVERHSPVTGGRAIAKAISPAYLTRKGGTEYE